jgi:RES domain-containing protein
MIIFRLSREKYKDTLSGYGASLNGQRWNSKGTEVIYAAESRALATSEVAVHIPLGILPKDYYMVEIDVPDDIKVNSIQTEQLPASWNSIPHRPTTQKIGDELVRENVYAVLKVPSAVILGDFNFIINPRHSDFGRIKILKSMPFPFDPRLLRQLY